MSRDVPPSTIPPPTVIILSASQDLKEKIVSGKLQTRDPDQLAWRRSNPVLLRRLARGWTRRKLARKCGLSDQGIYKIEAGRRLPRAGAR